MSYQSLLNLYKNALVTGGSSGLGKAFCDLFEAEGIKVYTTSRNKNKINKKFIPISLDLSNNTSVNNFLIYIKNIDFDLFINNAGSSSLMPFEDFSEKEINDEINILFLNQVKIFQCIYSIMKKRNYGTIVNVSSLAAKYPIPYMSLYNACKAAISSISESLMLEENSNIKIINIEPGDFKTNFFINSNSNNIKAIKTLEILKKRMNAFDNPIIAANKLKKILLKNKSGNFIIGKFLQTKIYPILLNILPRNIFINIIKLYYKIY